MPRANSVSSSASGRSSSASSASGSTSESRSESEADSSASYTSRSGSEAGSASDSSDAGQSDSDDNSSSEQSGSESDRSSDSEGESSSGDDSESGLGSSSEGSEDHASSSSSKRSTSEEKKPEPRKPAKASQSKPVGRNSRADAKATNDSNSDDSVIALELNREEHKGSNSRADARQAPKPRVSSRARRASVDSESAESDESLDSERRGKRALRRWERKRDKSLLLEQALLERERAVREAKEERARLQLHTQSAAQREAELRASLLRAENAVTTHDACSHADRAHAWPEAVAEPGWNDELRRKGSFNSKLRERLLQQSAEGRGAKALGPLRSSDSAAACAPVDSDRMRGRVDSDAHAVASRLDMLQEELMTLSAAVAARVSSSDAARADSAAAAAVLRAEAEQLRAATLAMRDGDVEAAAAMAAQAEAALLNKRRSKEDETHVVDATQQSHALAPQSGARAHAAALGLTPAPLGDAAPLRRASFSHPMARDRVISRDGADAIGAENALAARHESGLPSPGVSPAELSRAVSDELLAVARHLGGEAILPAALSALRSLAQTAAAAAARCDEMAERESGGVAEEWAWAASWRWQLVRLVQRLIGLAQQGDADELSARLQMLRKQEHEHTLLCADSLDQTGASSVGSRAPPLRGSARDAVRGRRDAAAQLARETASAPQPHAQPFAQPLAPPPLVARTDAAIATMQKHVLRASVRRLRTHMQHRLALVRARQHQVRHLQEAAMARLHDLSESASRVNAACVRCAAKLRAMRLARCSAQWKREAAAAIGRQSNADVVARAASSRRLHVWAQHSVARLRHAERMQAAELHATTSLLRAWHSAASKISIERGAHDSRVRSSDRAWRASRFGVWRTRAARRETLRQRLTSAPGLLLRRHMSRWAHATRASRLVQHALTMMVLQTPARAFRQWLVAHRPRTALARFEQRGAPDPLVVGAKRAVAKWRARALLRRRSDAGAASTAQRRRLSSLFSHWRVACHERAALEACDEAIVAQAGKTGRVRARKRACRVWAQRAAHATRSEEMSAQAQALRTRTELMRWRRHCEARAVAAHQAALGGGGVRARAKGAAHEEGADDSTVLNGSADGETERAAGVQPSQQQQQQHPDHGNQQQVAHPISTVAAALPKDVPPPEGVTLGPAVESVHNGDTALQPEASSKMGQQLQASSQSPQQLPTDAQQHPTGQSLQQVLAQLPEQLPANVQQQLSGLGSQQIPGQMPQQLPAQSNVQHSPATVIAGPPAPYPPPPPPPQPSAPALAGPLEHVVAEQVREQLRQHTLEQRIAQLERHNAAERESAVQARIAQLEAAAAPRPTAQPPSTLAPSQNITAAPERRQAPHGDHSAELRLDSQVQKGASGEDLPVVSRKLDAITDELRALRESAERASRTQQPSAPPIAPKDAHKTTSGLPRLAVPTAPASTRRKGADDRPVAGRPAITATRETDKLRSGAHRRARFDDESEPTTDEARGDAAAESAIAQGAATALANAPPPTVAEDGAAQQAVFKDSGSKQAMVQKVQARLDTAESLGERLDGEEAKAFAQDLAEFHRQLVGLLAEPALARGADDLLPDKMQEAAAEAVVDAEETVQDSLRASRSSRQPGNAKIVQGLAGDDDGDAFLRMMAKGNYSTAELLDEAIKAFVSPDW